MIEKKLGSIRIGVWRTVTEELRTREEKLGGARTLRRILTRLMGHQTSRHMVHAEVLHATATYAKGHYVVREPFGRKPDAAGWLSKGNRDQQFFTAIAGASRGLLSRDDLIIARVLAGSDSYLHGLIREAERKNANTIPIKKYFGKKHSR